MTKKQEEIIIKRVAKEITKKYPELKTKYEYDKIDDEWIINLDKEIKDEYVDFFDEKREEMDDIGIGLSIVNDLTVFRKELVEA